MKIKVIALLLVIIMMVSFAGCGIFEVNDIRDGQQSIADVYYGGLTLSLTKYELYEYFFSNAYNYIDYYGMSVEETMDYFKESMAYSKLNILLAIDEIAKLQGKTINTSMPIIDIIPTLLTDAEIKKAIDAANKTFQSSYDSFYEEIEAEYAALEPDEDEDDEDEEEVEEKGLEPRPTKEVEEAEEDFDPDAEVEIPKYFFETLVIKDKIGTESKRRLLNSLKNTG